ncbi:vegetative cell wall protein gp1-like [Forsythia ovata]|uniref:Vegetative cell wall protein gp1-like n=1 Tax=Forsythia ovata TaxID=205694 RepID=A0ABD1PK32_9LAMI
MSSPFAISCIRKSAPLYATIPRTRLLLQILNKNSLKISNQARNDTGSDVVIVKSPPEILTASPVHEPSEPPEVVETPGLPIFDPVPPERPSDPPPLSPGPNPGPEFPVPPHPSAPVPEAPRPPTPSPPGYPEVIPPHAPDTIPPMPPEPGSPPPRHPEIPSPLII